MSKPRLLIFGGTQFIGRAFVEQLLAEDSGFEITLFNRGESNPGLFPELKKIRGDRETSDIDQLLGPDWDRIVDINGYYPDTIEQFIPKLRGSVGRYVYVSTVSVYCPDYADKNILVPEDYPMLDCTAEDRTGHWSEHYGQKKAECERILLANDWLDTIILRPSIVYGKYDYTERFYYWLQRVKCRDPFLIPDNGSEKGNLTFVDDLAKLLSESLHVAKHNIAYNAVTHPMNSLREKISVMAIAMGKTPELISISPEEMKEYELRQPKDFPCVFGKPFLSFDNSKIQNDFDFKFTDYQESISETVRYYDSNSDWSPGLKSLSIDTEETILEKLKK